MSQTSQGLEEFKEEIRSILISSKDGLPLRKVSRDYYEFLGKPIPHRALGFSSELELFRAVPDAVRVVDRGELYLYAVCNEKTAHIEKLVSRQKKNPKVALSRSKNTHSLPPRMQRPITHNYAVQNNSSLPKIPPWLRTNILDLVSRHPQGLHIQNIKLAYRTAYGTDLNHQDYKYANALDFLRSLEDQNVLKLCENDSVIYSVQNFKQRQDRLVHSERVSNRENEVSRSTTKSEINHKKDDEFKNRNIFENLRKVIEFFPGGFPISQLCDNYKKVIGSVLDIQKLGFNNVQDFVSDLEDIFRVQVNRGGDWILIDARLSPEPEDHTGKSTDHEPCDKKEIPDHIQQNIYDLLKHFSDGIELQQFEGIYEANFRESLEWQKFGYRSLESMLMLLEFNPPIRFVRQLKSTVVILSPKDTMLPETNKNSPVPELVHTIPDDAVLLGQVHTPVKVPYNEKYFPVLVSNVDSPGKVWLQLVSPTEQQNVELDDLMNELAEFYQSPEADKYIVPDEYLKNGLNCAVLYPEDQDWHRGCITGKPGPTTYEVLYYDYGTVCVVEKSLLRLLKKAFSVLPAQAFPTRLAKMKPLSTFYSRESTSRLLELCAEKPLMAQITSSTYLNMNSVFLCDTTGEDDIFINDILVKEGLVESSDDQVDLRKPHVTSPDSYSVYNGTPISIPAQIHPSVMCHNPQISLASLGFYNSLGSVGTALNPTLYANSLMTDASRSLVAQNALINSQIYNPPISNVSLDNNSILDPRIFRRLEERALARRKMLEEGSNVPQATVEPIQVLKTRTLDSDFTGRDIPEYHSETDELVASQSVNNDENQEDEMYDSSREDDDIQESNRSTSSLATAKQLRFCKKVCFRDEKYSSYLINFNRQPCFTSAHLSSFIFGVDIVKRILQIQKYPPCHIVVSREDHPGLFQELEQLEIPGFTQEDAKADRVVLYSLSDVLKILVFLNHNKESLVEDIEEIQQSFDPDDEYWMTNEASIKVNTYEEALQEKFLDLKEERRLFLRVMLAEDYSSIDDAKRLLKIHEDIHQVKTEMSELRSQSKLKSASEQAREFLERAKLDFERQSHSESSTSTVLTSAIASTPNAPVCTQTKVEIASSNFSCNAPSSTQSTPVRMQANIAPINSNVLCAVPVEANQNTQNSNLVSIGQPAVQLQGYPVTNSFRVAQQVPVNYPTFFPNNYVYPQQNLQYATPGMRFPNPPYYYNQWKQ